MVPARQRLEAQYAGVVQRHDGLQVDVDQPFADVAPQLGFELELASCLGRLRFVVELERLPGHPLGAVHRGVGIADQRRPVAAVARVVRQADADRYVDLRRGELERLLDRARESLRQVQRLEIAGRAGDDDELVAAQPGHEVGVAHHAGQPFGGGADQLVAGGVAVGVVDLLEAVQVHEQHGEGLAVALRAGHRPVERLFERHAVGQAGQAVVVGQFVQTPVGSLQLALGGAQRGQVGEDADQHLLAARVQEHGLGGADAADAAIRVGVLFFVDVGLAGLEDQPVFGVEGACLLGREQIGVGLADEALARDAGKVAQGLVHQQEAQLVVLDQDRVGHRVDDVVQEYRVAQGRTVADHRSQAVGARHADARVFEKFARQIVWLQGVSFGGATRGRFAGGRRPFAGVA